MLPPVAPEVLSQNPEFSKLYQQLVTEKLNPHDASARSDDAEDDEVLEQVLAKPLLSQKWVTTDMVYLKELRTRRAELARRRIIREAVLSLTGLNSGLPDDVSPLPPSFFFLPFLPRSTRPNSRD